MSRRLAVPVVVCVSAWVARSYLFIRFKLSGYLQLTVAISLINTYLIIKHSFHATEKPQFSSYLYLFAGLESILSTRSEYTSARG